MERVLTDEEIKYEIARKRVKKIKGFYTHLVVYLIVNVFVVCLNIYNLKPGESYFKIENFFTAIFWGIGILIHGLSVFGLEVVFGSKWEERKIREIMEKDKQNSSQNWE